MSFSDFAVELEIVGARQAYADAQAYLMGATTPVGQFTVGWFGSALIETRGCFAVVNLDQDNVAQLVGEILRFDTETRSVYAYCVGRSSIPWDIAISRRAFLGLSLLSDASLSNVNVGKVA